MGLFRRPSRTPADPVEPTPFIAAVLHRIGEEYGGYDTISPLSPQQGGPGMEIGIHIAAPGSGDRPASLLGTGVIRVARVFPDHTDVYDGDCLIARLDDLSTADVFGVRGS